MRFSTVIVALGLALLMRAEATGADESPPSARRAIQEHSPWLEAATKHRVDVLDLYAIALQESRRRRSDGQVRPWPWTLHTPTEGSLYFENYEAAVAKLNQLLSSGATNVDVGLMQVNWAWNGHRLPDPAKLLLPRHNIDVAAEILREHLNSFDGDLQLAFARYHSSRIERGIPYAASVLKILEHLRSMDGIAPALANLGR